MSDIKRFYAGKSVFVTGGTGFMGKVLIEKLLWSCPDVGNIYLLIRSKKAKSQEDRMATLLSNMVFDRLRERDPKFGVKLVGIGGDISEQGLGISEANRSRIVAEVSVIFHLAATVRFDEKLPDAVKFNVHGVREIIELAKECSKLEAGVHVSTAYSNCVRRNIGEECYEPPLSVEEITKIVDIARKRNWSDSIIQGITNEILGNYPNTYTFTKAIAESIVKERHNELPFCIFRPSIVMSSVNEPYPGWTDNIMGITGMMLGIGLGVIHTALLDLNSRSDVVPVDMACNALLACAWKTSVDHKNNKPNQFPVYNYVSGPEAPLTWGELIKTTGHGESLTPSNSSVYYQSCIYTNSRTIYVLLEFLLHFIPALLIDNLGKQFGRQPVMVKLRKKVKNLTEVLTFFATREWDFDNRRIRDLWSGLSAEDKQTFPFSMKSLEWTPFLTTSVLGMRKFVLRENEDTIPRAKRRRLYLFVIHTIVRLLFVSFVLFILWNFIRWTKIFD